MRLGAGLSALGALCALVLGYPLLRFVLGLAASDPAVVLYSAGCLLVAAASLGWLGVRLVQAASTHDCEARLQELVPFGPPRSSGSARWRALAAALFAEAAALLIAGAAALMLWLNWS